VSEAGTREDAHVLPALFPIRYGVGRPSYDDPAAEHATAEHATTSRVAEPAGVEADVHVVPPSVVTTSKAEAAVF